LAGGSGEPSTELDHSHARFVIDPTRSSAAFEIDEVLRGEPQRMVGTTSEVAGRFEMDPDDVSSVEFSQIVVMPARSTPGRGTATVRPGDQ